MSRRLYKTCVKSPTRVCARGKQTLFIIAENRNAAVQNNQEPGRHQGCWCGAAARQVDAAIPPLRADERMGAGGRLRLAYGRQTLSKPQCGWRVEALQGRGRASTGEERELEVTQLY